MKYGHGPGQQGWAKRCTFISSYAITLLLHNVACVYTAGHTEIQKDSQISILMPKAIPTKEDALLCHGVNLNPDKTLYIVRFEPHASRKTAHHMMLYGCPGLGSSKPYWSCGSNELPVCHNGARVEILFAWALDAAGKKLPKDVGLRVSGDTPLKSLVLQIHYARVFQYGETDSSGLTVHVTEKEQPYQLGYFILGSWGYIPAQTNDYHMESACDYPNDFEIYPIAYRTHSHNLGVVTSGYRIRNGTWTEIGRMSPRRPQMFYNATTSGIDVKPGDMLAARCSMTNPRKTVTTIGTTNHDEMCNFYIMYYTKKKRYLPVQYCFRDAQQFKWNDYLDNIPADASSLSGVYYNSVSSSLFMGKG